MDLICIQCGNYRYFETDVESIQALSLKNGSLIVEDAQYEDWNFSDSTLRHSLEDIISYCLNESKEVLTYNPEKGRYENSLISCSRCGSKEVTKPYSNWTPPAHCRSLQEELMENRDEYRNLRKERWYADYM